MLQNNIVDLCFAAILVVAALACLIAIGMMAYFEIASFHALKDEGCFEGMNGQIRCISDEPRSEEDKTILCEQFCE